MKRIVTIALAALALSACEAGPVQPLAPNQPSLSQSTTTHFSTSFQATAMCAAEIGHIRFSGTIRGVDHTTVDANGETHRTRQFRVRGLTGVNLNDGTEYDVIGGAEMLTWNTQIGQVPGVAGKSIHSGTLVFDPVGGGSKVVAHHAIRFVQNASGELVVDFHEWRCQTQG
jgi:hypothetical protein